MKVSYYGYAFKNIQSNLLTANGLRDILSGFCIYDNVSFKNEFQCGEEKQFLLHHLGNLFLFLQTRSNELIKKIDSQSLSVSEIYDQLRRDERIGFASYVYVEPTYFAYASTMMAPRVKTFADFVNKILARLQVSSHTFVTTALLHQATREEVLSMPFVGRSTVQIAATNSIFSDFMNIIGGEADEFTDVDSFEITIKPKKHKNISSAAKRLINATPDAGLDKMVIKAKEAAHESLMELYLAGNGLISDQIDLKNERNLTERIREKIEQNTTLREKVEEYEHHDAVSHAPLDFTARYRNARAWADSFDGL
jgi:Intracellular sensor of Lambda phage, Abi component